MGDENPWENAANDDTWSQSSFSLDRERGVANESSSSSRNNNNNTGVGVDSTATTGGAARNHLGIPTLANEKSSCTNKLLFSLHILDGIVGIGCLIYGIIVQQHQTKPGSHIEALLVLLGGGTLFVIRSLSGCTQTKCGYNISGNLSLVASCWYFLLSMILLGMTIKGSLKRYLNHHLPTIPILTKFLHTHEHSLWSTMLGLCFIECIRWALIQKEIQNILFIEQTEYQQLQTQIYTNSTQRRTIPWWWNSNRNRNNNNNNNSRVESELSESLLQRPATGEIGQPNWTSTTTTQYHISDGISSVGNTPSKRSWWPWSSSQNPRDDGSVEYASLNEDWASRSEEDPLWWTKDDEEHQHHQQQSSTTGTDGASWAEES